MEKEKTPGDSLVSILKNTDGLVDSLKSEIKDAGRRIDGFGRGLSRFEKILYALIVALIALCVTMVFVSIQLTNTVTDLGETVVNITETIEPSIGSTSKITDEIAEFIGHINNLIDKLFVNNHITRIINR